MILAGRRVVLGVSGGIACYKACTIARRLTEMGAAVDVVLTSSAGRFVGPATFEALTHRPVFTSLWERDTDLAHLELGQSADLIILAPATANLIARAAQGIADDILTAMLLARTAPVLVPPCETEEPGDDTRNGLVGRRAGNRPSCGRSIRPAGPYDRAGSDRRGGRTENPSL